jgi:hypothetical protein
LKRLGPLSEERAFNQLAGVDTNRGIDGFLGGAQLSHPARSYFADSSAHHHLVQHWRTWSPAAAGKAGADKGNPAIHTEQDYEAVLGSRGARIYTALKSLQEAQVPMSPPQV